MIHEAHGETASMHALDREFVRTVGKSRVFSTIDPIRSVFLEKLDPIHRSVRARRSADDDQQPSGCDWSKPKSGSSLQGRSGDDSSSLGSNSELGAPGGAPAKARPGLPTPRAE
jgi:hypothetical protein